MSTHSALVCNFYRNPIQLSIKSPPRTHLVGLVTSWLCQNVQLARNECSNSVAAEKKQESSHESGYTDVKDFLST